MVVKDKDNRHKIAQMYFFLTAVVVIGESHAHPFKHNSFDNNEANVLHSCRVLCCFILCQIHMHSFFVKPSSYAC